MSMFELIIVVTWQVLLGVFYLCAAAAVFGSIALFMYVMGSMT